MSRSEMELFEKLCDDVGLDTSVEVTDELRDKRTRILGDGLFDIFPLLVNVAEHTAIPPSHTPSFGSNTSSTSATHGKVVQLAELLVTHTSPRELVLVVGEQLERANGDVDDCFLLDEDEDEDNEDGAGERNEFKLGKGDLAVAGLSLDEECDRPQHSEEKPGRTTLDCLIRRVLFCLDVLGAALARTDARKPPSDPLRSILLTLGEFIYKTYTAVNADAEYTIAGLGGLIAGTSRFCQSVWESGVVKPRKMESMAHGEVSEQGEGVLEGEEEIQAVVLRPMGQAVVLLHQKLGWRVLERWYLLYSSEGNETRPVSGTTDLESFKRDDADRPGVEENVTAAIKSALASFGHQTTTELVRLITHRLTGFLPHTALVLLTAPSQMRETMHYLDKETSKEEKRVLLEQSTAVLGSAMQGLASDAGCTWIWLIVGVIRADRRWDGNVREIWLEETTAEMALEWIVPIMVQSPGPPRRHALERLLARIPRLVESPEAWARLCDQIIAENNPFHEARLIGLKHVWEDIGKIQRRDEKKYLASFWKTLAPTIFRLPNCEPDIQTSSIHEVLDSIHPRWIDQGLMLALDFKDKDSGRIQAEEQVDIMSWFDQVEVLVTKWEQELGGSTVAGRVDKNESGELLQMRKELANLRGTLDIIEKYLDRT